MWALDRLGRDTLSNMLTIAEQDRLGVRVVYVQESWLDTTGPTRTLLVAVFPGSPSKSASAGASAQRLASPAPARTGA